jgi:phosphomannomutase/phosphoglucomutase
MITGSHNPPEYNGFKMMSGQDTLYGETIQEIHHIIRDGRILSDKEGAASAYDLIPEYQDYVVAGIKPKRRLKVVIDAGNGTGGAVAVPIFKRLGADVVELFCEMDGRFPNHHPDPTLPEAMGTLVKTVLAERADAGIAYDGDADRIGVVDDQGHLIWGDQLLIFFARDILKANPGRAIISEVKATKVLYDEIARLGGKPIMYRTGHSLIKKKIKEEHAVLAGEMSGHIFFADRWYGFDDALYSACRLMEIVAESGQPLSHQLADLPVTVATPEIRFDCPDEIKFAVVAEAVAVLRARHKTEDVDGVRVLFPHGWGLVRASNTQPILVMRFEATTRELLEEYRREIEEVVEAAKQRAQGVG